MNYMASEKSSHNMSRSSWTEMTFTIKRRRKWKPRLSIRICTWLQKCGLEQFYVLSCLWWLVSIINLTQYKVTFGESLTNGLSTMDWHFRHVHGNIILIKVNDVGRHSPPQGASFPKQAFLNRLRTETSNRAQASKKVSIHIYFSLLFIVDVIWMAASSFWNNDGSTSMTMPWIVN